MDRAELAAAWARLPAMHTLRRLAGPLTLVLLVAACAGTAAPSGSAASGGPPVTATPLGSITPAPSVLPSATDDPNGAVGTDVPPSPSGDVGNPPQTVAKPGQLGLHPVAIDGFTAAVTGRHVLVTVTWTSGVEPCYVLDHIVVERDAASFIVTVIEGHGPGDNICIEIAQIKHAQIDLGELEPGTYTIEDSAGRAIPIEVTVN